VLRGWIKVKNGDVAEGSSCSGTGRSMAGSPKASARRTSNRQRWTGVSRGWPMPRSGTNVRSPPATAQMIHLLEAGGPW